LKPFARSEPKEESEAI